MNKSLANAYAEVMATGFAGPLPQAAFEEERYQRSQRHHLVADHAKQLAALLIEEGLIHG